MPTIAESIQVWIVRLDGQTPENWRPFLAESEWEKAMRFRLQADRVRSAVTRGVLRTLLAQYLDRPATAIEFTHNPHGKPAVSGGGIEFNVSLSGEYALLGFARDAVLGVDVEHITGTRIVSDLAQRILTPDEYKRFSFLPEEDRERTFFQIWTLKESVMKAMGTGLSIAPECIEIRFPPEAPQFIGQDGWTLQSLDIGNPRYAAAITIAHSGPMPIEMHHYERAVNNFIR